MALLPGSASAAHTPITDSTVNWEPRLNINPAPIAAYDLAADFATLEPVSMLATADQSSDTDTEARLRRVAWLFGPSLLAMGTVARRRKPDNKR